MKNRSSGGGATALMIVSIVILAAAVAVTLFFTLRDGQDADAAAGPPTLSENRPWGKTPEADASPSPAASGQQTPDWMVDEAELDALAAQFSAGVQGEDSPEPTPEPSPEPTPEPSPEPSAPPESFVNPFSDVKESDYFYAPVMWAARQEIVSGESFSPAAVCSRAQAITFLWRQQGEPEPKLGVSPFTDVAPSDYFYKPVLWAFESGLISTPSDGRFKPDDAVNRAQVMTFLYRVSGGSARGLSNPYSNVSPGDYYYEPALWAYDRGIVILDGGDSAFDATSACTRAQYITFLYRCFAPDAQGGQ